MYSIRQKNVVAHKSKRIVPPLPANTQISAAVVCTNSEKKYICFVFRIRISIHLKQYIFNTQSNTIRIYCFPPANICQCNDSVICTIVFLYFINPLYDTDDPLYYYFVSGPYICSKIQSLSMLNIFEFQTTICIIIITRCKYKT